MAYKTPLEVAKNTCSIAVAKASQPLSAVAMMGFLAGAYIAFGGSTMMFVLQDLPQHIGLGLGKFIGGIVFSMALLLILVAGGELFTGNSLMTIGSLTGCVPPGKVLKNWVIVYFTNLAGAVALTLLIHYSGAMNDAAAAGVLKVAAGKVNLTASQMFIRGILCNWLVAIAVWMSYAAMDIGGKFVCCFVPVAAFTALGYEHSVANMYFFAHGLLLKSNASVVALSGVGADKLANLSLWGCIVNLVPVTAGNIVGGAICVATFYFIAHRRNLQDVE